MRQLNYSRITALLAISTLGVLPTGCLLDHNPAPFACRLTTTLQFANALNPFFMSENWIYSTNGQLVSTTRQEGRTPTTNQYTYDSNGYVISNETSVFTPLNRLSGELYGYQNGRLTTVTRTSLINQAIDRTTTYEYDSAGKLTRIIVAWTDPARTETYAFSNGLQTGYKTSTATNPDGQPYTFENGLVKTSASPIPATYTYDNQGRRTRVDFSGTGLSTDYILYEYTTGKLAADAAPPLFKGWPVELQMGLNSTGEGRGLLAKVRYFVKDGGGSAYRYREVVFTYTQNSNGFPLTTQAVDRSYNTAGEQTGERTYDVATYTYDNCQ